MVFVQPHELLYDEHGLERTNGVVKVQSHKPFRLLIARFRKYPIRVLEGQMVAKLLLHPRAVCENKATIGEVRLIQERTKEKFPKSTVPPTRESSLPPSDQEREDQPKERSGKLSASAPPKPQRRVEPPPPHMNEIDLSHAPDRLRERFLRILKNILACGMGLSR